MKRRDVLRGGAVAAGGGLAAVAGLQLAADADAQASTTLDVADDRALVGADDELAAVWLDVTVEWSYTLPDGVQPDTVIVELLADETVVATNESAELFLDADGSEDFEVDLLAEGVLAADALTPDAGERSTEVALSTTLRVENSDGELLADASASDTATVTIERDDYQASEYGSVGGTGELRIETV